LGDPEPLAHVGHDLFRFKCTHVLPNAGRARHSWHVVVEEPAITPEAAALATRAPTCVSGQSEAKFFVAGLQMESYGSIFVEPEAWTQLLPSHAAFTWSFPGEHGRDERLVERRACPRRRTRRRAGSPWGTSRSWWT
jgi:hypothetical protein